MSKFLIKHKHVSLKENNCSTKETFDFIFFNFYIVSKNITIFSKMPTVRFLWLLAQHELKKKMLHEQSFNTLYVLAKRIGCWGTDIVAVDRIGRHMKIVLYVRIYPGGGPF